MQDAETPETSTPLPVTVVVSRRPAEGAEARLLGWAAGITAAAERFPGHLGAQIYPPTPPDREDVVIAFSFADAGALSVWERSPERLAWIERARPFTVGQQTAHAVSGFEGIFAPTIGATTTPPPRWKTAVVIALALYPASLLLNWLLVPHIASWNLFVRVLITTALIVPFMVWAGVPWITARLRRWLRPAAP
jgi:antibiotic biosynthesis monooxygenase (ABM) superfamily enzyme